MPKRRTAWCAFCCAVALNSASWSATLEPGQGNLSVNQGRGFQPVNSRVDAKIGDSIMVSPGGSAAIVYDDGCKVTVQPGAVTTIAPLSPCAAGSNAADMGVPPARGAGYPAPPPDTGDPWLLATVGVLGGAALGVGIYEATKSSGSTTPASP